MRCIVSDETSCMQLINSLLHAISGQLLFISKATHDVSEKYGHIYRSLERAAAITYQNVNVLGLLGCCAEQAVWTGTKTREIAF